MKEITPELLKKYFKNLCSNEEKAKVEQWLSTSDDEFVIDEVFKGIDKQDLKENIWHEVKPVNAHTSSKIYPQAVLRIAVSIAVCILITTLLFQYHTGTNNNQSGINSEFRVLKTVPGERLKYTLSDGTVIHLNSGSELQVPAHFSDTIRSIHLTGEAYLEVTKDKTRPFIVVTSYATIQVLGTKFNVKAYSDEYPTTITVEEGKVRVCNIKGNQLLLNPNQTAICSSQNSKMFIEEVHAKNITAWKEGKLVFRNQPLDEIATILERWYNIRIEIQNAKIKEFRFTGSFSDNPALISLVKEMSMVMQFRYELNKNKLIIY